MNNTHIELVQLRGTGHSLAEPGIAVAWLADYRIVDSTADNTVKNQKKICFSRGNKANK